MRYTNLESHVKDQIKDHLTDQLQRSHKHSAILRRILKSKRMTDRFQDKSQRLEEKDQLELIQKLNEEMLAGASDLLKRSSIVAKATSKFDVHKPEKTSGRASSVY